MFFFFKLSNDLTAILTFNIFVLQNTCINFLENKVEKKIVEDAQDWLKVIFSLVFLQVVLCQINIICHQLTQNTTTDFVRFTQIVLKFKTHVLQVLNFIRTICKVNLTKLVVIFWVNWWQDMLIWQRITFIQHSSLADYLAQVI